jgi:hypothetical protein
MITENEKQSLQGSIETLNSFQLTENMENLDAASKNVLHSTEVLSIILSEVVDEYHGYSRKDVKGFIDNGSRSEDMEVSPGRTNTVLSGEATEYQVLNEKTSMFDIAFSALNPVLSNTKVHVRLHFDEEPQKTYRPGYPIEKRGYYYLSRRLSSQLSLAIEGTDYNSLEKCYSIWICRDDVPKDEQYSISIYEITNSRNYGNCHPMKEDYDLMTLVIIRLGDMEYNGKEGDEFYDLFKFLNLIMYPHKENFIEDMREFIDFSDNEDLKKEADDMSGLGQCIHDDGEAKGIVLSGIKHGDSENDILKDLQESLKISLQKAKSYLNMYGGKTV